MSIKNKIAAFVTLIAFGSSIIAGCGSTAKDETANSDASDKKSLSIVTTIFPEYDWVENILGDRAADANVTMLMDNGVDLHNYQATAEDLLKVSNCDVFVYVGGESDGWVNDALTEADNKNMQVVNLMDTLGKSVKEEQIVEGMQAEEEESEEEEDKPEYDEHVWLSLKNAETLCSAIADAIGKADPENAEIYMQNAKAYSEKLSELDSDYSDAVNNANKDTLLFGDRFPFRYMTDDYRINYYAAFVGCSAETEASFKTITFLADKIDKLGLKYVMTIENSDDKIAKTIIENTKHKNQDILELNSMQSVTAQDIKDGATYLGIMRKNLGVLKKALN